jgi:PAS domain S-box-containing protein
MAAKRRKKIVPVKNEGAVSEPQSEFRRVIDAINDGICLLSNDQKIVTCNRAMAKMFNMRFEEMAGRYCFEVVHGTDRPVPGCPVEKMRKSLMRETMELERQGRWFDVTVDPLLDETGDLAGILHIVREITQRKKTEKELLDALAFNSEIISSVGAGVIVYDREFRYREWNRFMEDLTGMKKESVLGRTAFEIFPHLQEQGIDRLLEKALSGETVVSPDMRFRAPATGKSGWTVGTYAPHKNAGGEIIGVIGLVRDITQRKKAEDSMRESEEKYRILAESSPEMIYLIDKEGVVRYVNKTGLAMFKGGAAVIGKHLRDIYPPSIAERHLKALRGVIERDRPVSTELLEEFPTGKRWIDARLTPVKDSSGAITGVLGLSADITERKKAQESLAQSEEKFRAIIEQNSEGIILIDEECFVIEWNPAMERITGIRSDRAKGMPVWEIQGMTADPLRWTPERAEQMKKMFIGAVKTGWSPLFNTPVEAVMVRNREKVYIQQTIFPIKTAKGFRLGSITRDITERKTAEATLKRSEEKYKALFEHAGEAIMLARISNTGQQFVDFNSRALDLFQMTKEELLRCNPASLSPERQPDGRLSSEAISVNIARVLEGESVVIEWVHRKKDGTDIPCEVTLNAIEYAGERVVQAIVRDTTERKKLEERMARDEKLESLQVFAGGIAHDFNNLLAGIFGNIDLARVELPDDNPAQHYLNNSFLAFGRARHLAQQLLTFAKGGAPQKRPLRLPGTVMNASALALSGSNVKAEYRFAEGLWPVEADENQLSQVISNLVINAWQAMPQGGIVTITAENHTLEAGQAGELPAGKYVALMIEDRGIGIPENIIDKIFDPFFTTKQQGSGLGLATSFSIISRHNGTLEVVSEPGRGTVFTIMLPATDREIAEDENAWAISDLRGSGRILVMDDEGLIRRIVCDMLSMAGYEVETVSEGREAVKNYREALEIGKRFDAVILDLTVPGGMGGMETVGELLKIDPRVLAIVSSGYSDSAGMSHYTEHGFADRVPKPYSLKELLSAVKNVLESRKK